MTQGTLPIERILRPFEEFTKVQSSGGILLLLCAGAAMLWANSPWGESYFALWQTPVAVGFADFVLSKPLVLWINDGLMSVFFFVVGLEIKREVLVGELASPKHAALPVAAAVGGMVVPAAIYAAINVGTDGASGWGIPMATDIAFALGVLALLGTRAPVGLKIFLAALAIVDDLGAVLVIALFYSSHISWLSLGVGAVFLLALIGANRAGVRHPLVYAILGIGGVWLAFLLSGIHPAIAGVLNALTIPARARLDTAEFLARCKGILERFMQAGHSGREEFMTDDHHAALGGLAAAAHDVQTPMERLEHGLHPWVTFAIMPIFALANAGVPVGGDVREGLSHPITLGVIVGLVLGKPLGISLFAWLAVRGGLAVMPANVTARHIHGAAWLGGIGFTMSLFIASLALGETPFLPMAKVGILAGSCVAGVVGWSVLRWSRP
jgi:NhaA family Na+:H+ antiporter